MSQLWTDVSRTESAALARLDTGSLTEWGRQVEADDSQPSPPASGCSASELALAVACAEAQIRGRQARQKAYPELRFADPAWDIMLDIFISTSKGRLLSVGDLAIGADLPTSTALRWSDYLVRQGIVRNVDDPNDRRRKLVSMSGDQFSRLASLLARMASVSTPR